MTQAVRLPSVSFRTAVRQACRAGASVLSAVKRGTARRAAVHTLAVWAARLSTRRFDATGRLSTPPEFPPDKTLTTLKDTSLFSWLDKDN